MIFLVLAVGCSVLLGFIFKLFPRFGVHTYQAIVVNYFTCVACGWIHSGRSPVETVASGGSWLPYAFFLGFVFISGFNLAAQTVRHFGVTISQIMQRMSILLTVPFAIFVYGESSGWAKWLGFLMAMAAIVLVNLPQRYSNKVVEKSSGRFAWIPALTWLLAGVIEVVFVHVQKQGLTDTNDPAFISTVFGTAGVLGLLGACWGYTRGGGMLFSWKNVLGGILLGIPNYGSMFFLLLALGKGMEGSFVFPVSNISIIVLTTIGAVSLFNERLSRANWLGIAFSLVAILLISL